MKQPAISTCIRNSIWLSLRNLVVRGIPYSVGIMLILGAHELGHYFAARHHKVPVTLPYFYPFSPSANWHHGRIYPPEVAGKEPQSLCST